MTVRKICFNKIKKHNKLLDHFFCDLMVRNVTAIHKLFLASVLSK